MAVFFRTSNPSALLKAFNDRINQDEQEGKITTWEQHKHNNVTYYTHKAAAWHKKAYFKAVVGDNILTFNIIRPEDQNITVTVYGYYHGHLTETFLNHFDSSFNEAISSSNPVNGDIIQAST